MKIQDSRLFCKICLCAASVTLALAMVMLAFTVAAQSVQAQTYTVLYTFTDGKDGGRPNAGLAVDQAGNLYGTTEYGGANGSGTVYKLVHGTGGAWTEKILYSFQGTDGWEPFASVIPDAAGNLYGATYQGGTPNNGLVFEIVP